MAADKYTSILAMRLQMEQQQQQQERAEALQREQMNDQMEMKSLDMMVKTGQNYFAATKAADDRDLKIAEAKYKQDLAYAKEEREDKAARAKAGAELLKADVKRQHDVDMQEDKQLHQYYVTDPAKMARTKELTKRKVVLTRGEERKMMNDEVKGSAKVFEKLWEPVGDLRKNLGKGRKPHKMQNFTKQQVKDAKDELRKLAGIIGGFEARLDSAEAKKGGVEENSAHIGRIMNEFKEWLKTEDGKRFIFYAGADPMQTTPSGTETPQWEGSMIPGEGPALPDTAIKRAATETADEKRSRLIDEIK